MKANLKGKNQSRKAMDLFRHLLHHMSKLSFLKICVPGGIQDSLMQAPFDYLV
jgi:hypothetical protein